VFLILPSTNEYVIRPLIKYNIRANIIMIQTKSGGDQENLTVHE